MTVYRISDKPKGVPQINLNWRCLAFFLRQRRERLITRPNQVSRQKALFACGVCQALQQKESRKSKKRPAKELKSHILFMPTLGQLLRKSKAPKQTKENVTPRKQAK